MENGIQLSEMIQELRKEIIESTNKGLQESIVFEVEKVELEIEVAVSKSKEGSGGIKFWVVTIGGKKGSSNTQTHTFKITLNPKDKTTNKKPLVSDDKDGGTLLPN